MEVVYSQKPEQFYKFMEMCSGIGLDDDSCKLVTRDYKRGDCELRSEISIEDETGSKKVTFSYTKDVDFSPLDDEIEDLRSDVLGGKEDYVERYINFIYDSYRSGDSYLMDDILQRIDKSQRTEENIRRLIQSDAEAAFDYAVRNLASREEYREQLASDMKTRCPEGSVSLPDMDIFYSQDMLEGGIHTADGGFILFAAQLDENNEIHSVRLNRYGSFIEVAYSMDNDEPSVDYRFCTEELLREDCVVPVASATVDFEQLLLENGMTDYTKKPIGAFYRLRDVLTEKTMVSGDSKKSAK